ncbi:hypothetical protein Ddye_027919 [Dipteronia dyeriana]|uniref:CBS domain-containing protein n=1 Tax=Dipteronia dyeriana TaxID=168575 RepID=A0AAD9WQM4_9ROSI|nr:hypothetical protein Ddye_027919 [Dipteronia dyeriana]
MAEKKKKKKKKRSRNLNLFPIHLMEGQRRPRRPAHSRSSISCSFVYSLRDMRSTLNKVFRKKMQRAVPSLLFNGNAVKTAVLERFWVANPMILRPAVFSWFQSAVSARMEEHGFKSTRITEVLKAKGKGADGSWLWCTTDDSVYDAVKSNKLFTFTPDTKVLIAMQLMTDNRIKHIPAIDDKEMIGMVFIGDVVRAVVSEHREELDHLTAYIRGGY